METNKNPKQDSSKLNPVIFEKNYTSQVGFISKNQNCLNIWSINIIPHINRI